MLRDWQFGATVLGLGALSFFSGLAGKWGDSEPPKYSDETTWAVRVGIAIMVIGGLLVLYASQASRKESSASASSRHVISTHSQGGGITAHTVNLGKKGEPNGEEE